MITNPGSIARGFCFMSVYPSGLRDQSAKLKLVGSNPTADSDIQPSRQMARHPVQVVRGWLGCVWTESHICDSAPTHTPRLSSCHWLPSSWTWFTRIRFSTLETPVTF
jgi:hypothetical protein